MSHDPPLARPTSQEKSEISLVKYHIDILPTLAILNGSVKEWYDGPPRQGVSVAIVTRSMGCIIASGDIGSHWGTFIDGSYWHFYGFDDKKNFRSRKDNIEKFSRGYPIITYVLHDHYYLPIFKRIRDNFTPGPFHPLTNNCQHSVQKMVFGNTVVKQTSPILHYLDLTNIHDETRDVGIWTGVEAMTPTGGGAEPDVVSTFPHN